MDPLLARFPTKRLLGLDLACASLFDVAAALAERPADADFSYIVTPNADHFVRLARQPGRLQTYYRSSGALLLDSRVVYRLGRLLGLPVPPVVTGSDLTEILFDNHIARDEPVTIVGTTRDAVRCLVQNRGLSRVAHFAPPFGFETNLDMVDRCVRFVQANPSRFVFLACGAPRQELLAHRIVQCGGATGIGLCIGAAIDQIGGLEKRAPSWMRRGGLEWVWRILCEPKRLGLRYLQDLAIIPALVMERSRQARRLPF
jgi:N-acetylglucosaminyldiphosphoundecaprenol N-acetyl-beta-D-mannosaminyltransferase